MTSRRFRHKLAQVLLVATLLGWPATHVLLVVTHPAGASWVFHLLLALTYLQLTLTTLGIIATTHAHKDQDGD